MKFKKVRWVLLFGLLFIVVPVKPDSKEFVDIYKVFIENELPSNQQIKESFFNLGTTPFSRKELAFSLLVPKDWRDNPLKVSPEVLEHDTENMVPVTLQLAPEDEKGNVRIEVAYIRMERELDLSDLVDFNRLKLEADLDSNLDAPLGKLKKWEAILSESQIEVSLLVWPKGSSYLSLGILTPSPQVSRYTWMHAWKVFDIIASELIEKQLPLIRIKNLNLPQEDWLADRALRTMSIFSWGVMNEDFSRFYADLAPVFQASTAPQKLLQTFKRFKQREELNELEKHVPVLDHPIWINEAGELPLSGCFSTCPRNTCFEFIYKHAQEEWKLVSVHVFLEDRDEK